MPARDLSADARALFAVALSAADAEAAVAAALRLDGDRVAAGAHVIDLTGLCGVRLLAMGKAAPAMARGALRVLGTQVQGGLCVTETAQAAPLSPLEVLGAAHPVPDERSLLAGERVLAEVGACTPDTLLIVLLSGGTSSLVEALPPSLPLEDLARLHQALLRCGAPIAEMNAVRAALSRVKGGGLLRALPRRVPCLVLVVSDVPGGALHVVGSGPFAAVPAPASAARAVLERRGLWAAAPTSVRQALQHAESADADRALRLRERAAWAPHVSVADNQMMVDAVVREAQAMGYASMVLSTVVSAEARETGALLAAVAREMRLSGQPLVPPACVVASGETTVTVTGPGRGGRCQEVALGFAVHAAGEPGVALLCGASDGVDGPSGSAGALADGTTTTRAEACGLDARRALLNNDTAPVFEALGDRLVTGPTGTNTNELYVLLVG